MEKGKKIPPQEASRTNPVAKPEDTKCGINNKVSSGLIGKKLAEQAEENEEMPMHHLIADKDYPSGIREWMITSPSDLKYPTLVLQQQVDTTQGSFDTGCITVIQDRDIASEAMYQADLSLCEGCTR